jgi:hypothetical protein
MGLNPLLFMRVSFVYGDPLFVRVDIFPLFLWSLIVHAFSHTHSWCFSNSLSLMMAVSTIHKIINQIIWKL